MKINIKRDEMIIENIAAIFYTLSSKRFLPFFINSFMLFPLLSRSCRYHLDLLSHPQKLNAARPRSLLLGSALYGGSQTITHLFSAESSTWVLIKIDFPFAFSSANN